MIDASNIPGREYATYLQPLLQPLKQISTINAEKNKISKRYFNENKNAGSILPVFVVGFPIVFYFIVPRILDSLISVSQVKSDILKEIIAFILVVIILSSALLGYFIGKKLFVDPKKKKIKMKYDTLLNEKSEQINTILSSIYDQLNAYVPQTYWYYHAVSNIYDYLVTGRADSWKEAINLYEDVKHKQRLEQNAAIQSEYAAITAANSQRAANAATATAINTLFR